MILYRVYLFRARVTVICISMRRSFSYVSLIGLVIMQAGCVKESGNGVQEVQLITLDPGHFHAALVQKYDHRPAVDSNVFVYAPEGSELIRHLELVDSYNTRTDQPTAWAEHIYIGPDFLEKMVARKEGNVVVIAGNNRNKPKYVTASVTNGFHVLSDKPMIIRSSDFAGLKANVEQAEKAGLLLYDIMTERCEITSRIQRELVQIPELFGTIQPGTPEDPAVVKESVHHFFKEVSGKPLVRPAWFFDTEQQGEGLVDVTTHLVDLVQWTCFPDEAIDYRKDINMIDASRNPSSISLRQFSRVTGLPAFPDFLRKDLSGDSVLSVYSNGEMTYALRGIHARVSVRWDFEAGPGRGDTHYSEVRGTRARLVIRQGAEQKFRPVLYIEPLAGESLDPDRTARAFRSIPEKFPGVELAVEANGFRVVIPDTYHTGHEAHFGEVFSRFLEYLRDGNMPAWEMPNLLAKYYTTTKALELALQK